MNEKLLEELGLTKGEIKVYLSLLKLGETTTGKIIENAEISSGKIYEILDKLAKKGLVGVSIKEKTKYFSAASPNRILDYVHEKEKELKEQEKVLEKELPLLLKMESKEEKNENQLFVGIKGIQTAIFESLEKMNPKEEVLAMGIRSSKEEKYNLLWQRWHVARIKKKIKCRIIFSDKNTDYYKAMKKMKLINIRVLKGITPSAIDIIGNRVLIFTYEGEPSCLLIKNPQISASFKSFFETLWSSAKP